MADKKTAATSQVDKAMTSTGADAGTTKPEDVKLNENSQVETKVDPKKTADPGEINEGATAGEIQPSGAISEAEAVADVPVDHPAIDNNPRKGLPPESNRIDFNDPSF